MGFLTSGAHLHLLVNHAPILGASFAAVLLLASYFAGGDVLRRTAFVVLIGTALAAAISDLSGDQAIAAIRGFPGVSRTTIHAHEDAAAKAYLVAGIVGVLAIAALVRWRRVPIPQTATHGMLAAAFIVSGLMAYTGLLGGQVRHTEVRPGAVAADAIVVEPARLRAPATGEP